MFGRDKFKVIKVLNRRQHTSKYQRLAEKKKKDLNMKTSLTLFWAPKVKSKLRTIFNLTTDIYFIQCNNSVTKAPL